LPPVTWLPGHNGNVSTDSAPELSEVKVDLLSGASTVARLCVGVVPQKTQLDTFFNAHCFQVDAQCMLLDLSNNNNIAETTMEFWMNYV